MKTGAFNMADNSNQGIINVECKINEEKGLMSQGPTDSIGFAGTNDGKMGPDRIKSVELDFGKQNMGAVLLATGASIVCFWIPVLVFLGIARG
jgi:hypothetical protein